MVMSSRTAALGALAGLALALAACATPTPYQPLTPGHASAGGFREVQVEPGRFRVSVKGNSLTSRETVEQQLLYRAAELTLAQGYDGFVTADRHTDRNVRTIVEPDPFMGGYAGWHPYWRFYGAYGWRSWNSPWGDPFWNDRFWNERYETRSLERFEAMAEIVMFRGAKAPGDPQAFDARSVMRNLEPQIRRPTAATG